MVYSPRVRAARFAVLAAVIVLIGLVGYYAGSGKKTSQKPYQAVFLTNGQVYFGKIIERSSTHTTLTDIYYLQVQQPIQPPPAAQTSAGKPAEQPQIQLIKLGGELHKPKDQMLINNDHILFVEEIENDGQVVQGIDRLKRGETSPTPAPQPAPESQ